MIRDALPHEYGEIAELSVTAYQEFANNLSASNWEIMRSNLSNIVEVAKTGRLIVAEREKLENELSPQKLMGAIIYCPPGTSDPKIFQPEWASIKMLSVASVDRSRGVGTQLCLECIRRARQDNAEIISLHTSELMVAARAMYTKLGFELDIELPQRLNLHYWRYVMRL